MLTKLAKASAAVVVERPKRRNDTPVEMMGSAAENLSTTLIEAAREVLAIRIDRKRLAMKHPFTNYLSDDSDVAQPGNHSGQTQALSGKRDSTSIIYIEPYRGCSNLNSVVKQSNQGSKQTHTVVKIAIGPLYPMSESYWLLGSWPKPFIQS